MTDSPRPDLVDPAGVPLAAAPAPVAPAPAPQPAPAPVAALVQPAPAAAVIAPAPAEAPTAATGASVVTVNSSALQGQMLAAATGLARLGGAYLVAHGVLTAAQATSIEPTVVDLITGTALAVAGQLVAQAREWLSHHKKVELALTNPANVTFK